MASSQGVGDPLLLEELGAILRRPGFTPADLKSLIKTYGLRGVCLGCLDAEVRKRKHRRRMCAGYPPRAFISYKWDGKSHAEWVRRFCDGLHALGYEIVLDQYDCHVEEALDVPRYVATMLDCRLVFMICTTAFAESGTWVFDEIQLAVSAAGAGVLEIVPVLKEDDVAGADEVEGFVEGQLQVPLERALDFRGAGDPYERVLAVVPPAPETVLTPEDEHRLEDLVAEVTPLLDRGEIRLAGERMNAAPASLWPTAEFECLAARVYAAVGDAARAVEIAGRLCASRGLHAPTRVELAQVLRLAGERRRALAELLPLGGRGPYAVNVHYLVGNLLDELGEARAGVNHLRFSLRCGGESADVHNDLGVLYKHLGGFEAAEECFLQANRLDPSLARAWANRVVVLRRLGRDAEADLFEAQAAGRFPDFAATLHAVARAPAYVCRAPAAGSGATVRCHDSRCGAEFRLDPGPDAICPSCGAVHPATLTRCPACELTREPDRRLPARCPVCRMGRLG